MATVKKFFEKPVGKILGCLAALLLCACNGDITENVDLKLIQDCKELEAAEFNFHKIIVERSTLSAFNVLGHGIDYMEKVLVLPVDVKVVGKIDFSNVTESNLMSEGDKLIFILPDPKLRVVSVEPDWEMRSKASKEGMLHGGKFSDEEIKRFANQAKDSILVERTLKLMVEQTRSNAASILIPIISSTAGIPEEKVIVRFDSDLDLSAAMYEDRNIIFRTKELNYEQR